jgi:APA family basic amino acid/polyamine antiporter
LVKGLGLTSATMLVWGSMIGSGIFIVSAEIAREVDSPALLIGAWAVAGFMTIVAALSYGELAAMMPRAGGAVCLSARSARAVVGLSLRLDSVSGDSDRDDCGCRRGVRQVPRSFLFLRFLPPLGFCISGRFHRFALGPMVLCNMDVGINTQNLVAICS